MVTATSSSQIAQQLMFTRNISLLTQELNKQNEQLSSQRYSGGLVGVSQRALELGSLKSQLGTVDNYVSGVQTAQNRVGLYATTIEKIIDIATNAQDMMLKNRDAFFAQTAAPRVQVNTFLDQVGSMLQTKDGARYLFAGVDYTANPINGQLSALATTYAANAVPGTAGYPVPFTAAANQAAWPPAPYTSGNFLLSNDATAQHVTDTFNYQGVTLYSDDTEQATYGVSAAEDGFQQLVDSLIRFRDATADVTTNPNNYQARVDDARTQLATAINSLKTIASRNGYVQQQLQEIQDRHAHSQDVLKTRIGAIEDVDVAQVSVTIKNLQSSLEASYVITRDTLQLSLVKYLS